MEKIIGTESIWWNQNGQTPVAPPVVNAFLRKELGCTVWISIKYQNYWQSLTYCVDLLYLKIKEKGNSLVSHYVQAQTETLTYSFLPFRLLQTTTTTMMPETMNKRPRTHAPPNTPAITGSISEEESLSWKTFSILGTENKQETWNMDAQL